MKWIFIAFLAMSVWSLQAQNNKELAWNKAKEAIELMDAGQIEESVALLEECKKLDPTEHTYPYEIAYAHVIQKEYKSAVKILQKVKKYEGINSQVYQMLGNCYSYLGNPKKAIKEYEAGMKKFPNAGNLHLEKGNIFLMQEDYNKAVMNYKNGIAAEPMYPSNYYRLALLYLSSDNKLNGLIYGELFLNIERTTARTQEISELLYQTYESSISFGEKEGSVTLDFCEITLFADDLKKGNFDLPLCAPFGKNFVLATIGQSEVSLQSVSQMRSKFIEFFFEGDEKEYPNVLFDYHQKMIEAGVFEAYNHYVLQIGAPNEFEQWLKNNEEQYDAFVEWYTQKENVLEITDKNQFLD